MAHICHGCYWVWTFNLKALLYGHGAQLIHPQRLAEGPQGAHKGFNNVMVLISQPERAERPVEQNGPVNAGDTLLNVIFSPTPPPPSPINVPTK